jgi:hypothetical protein
MGRIPTDPKNGVESELLDIGMVPLAARSEWRSDAIRAAMRGVIRGADRSQVFEQSGGGHNASC